MKQSNKVIYYPSLTSGPSKDWLINKPEYRYYVYNPYTLISAGHNYQKHPNLRKDIGAEAIFVMGDSGGYQLATGVLTWKEELREDIFNWLENNSDIAIALDVPPKLYPYKEALKISKKNFEYFEKNQSGKVKYLNVLQGTNPTEYKNWFYSVKHFNFNGWAIASCASRPRNILYTLSLLLDSKQIEKCEFLHYFTLIHSNDITLLIMLQHILNKKYDIKLSFDNSFPSRLASNETYIFNKSFDKSTLFPYTKEIIGPSNWHVVEDTEIKLTLHNIDSYINYIDIFTGILDNQLVRNNLFTTEQHLQYISLEHLIENDNPLEYYLETLKLFI